MQRLNKHLFDNGTPAELIRLIDTLAVACKDIAFRLQHAGISGILGSAGEENIQGETQKKLDVISNDLIKEFLLSSGTVKALASEEEDSIVVGDPNGGYLVAFDPLDGSSNIDINSLVGTIFSIFKAPDSESVSEDDFLIAGRQQVAAGYVLYGPSVMMALTTGNGVQMYTLEQCLGEFLLTSDSVAIAPEAQEFSINMSNQRFWAAPMQQYIADLIAGTDGPRDHNFNMRWVAAMVGDVHRILCRGGLFSYPWDSREPEKAGKLRLMYEANPMALLIEQAGGSAYTDKSPILDIQPEDIHQRVPVILGASNEVALCVDYHKKA